MKPVVLELPENLERIDVHLLGDWHIGDPLCDLVSVAEKLDEIRDNPNAYCILGGDLCDMALRDSIGDVHGAKLSPMGQVERVVSLIKPVQEKVLCMVRGNHENRVYKSTGIDPLAFAASELGLGERYSDTSALLFVQFGHDTKHGGRMQYTMYVTHGAGSGRKEGGKLQRLADLQNIIDCDIYCHNHTHLPAVFPTCSYRIDYTHRKPVLVEHLFVNGGASLSYGGYADAGGFKPAGKRHPVIHLTSGRKHFTATL